MSCDGNTYHIPGIHLWALKGNVCWVDPNFQQAKYMNGYPKGVELVAFVLVRAMGTHVVTMANLVFLPLGVLGVACLAQWLRASRPMVLVVAAAYVLVPVNISQAATTYTDSAFASCAVGFIAAIVQAVRRLSGQRRCGCVVYCRLWGRRRAWSSRARARAGSWR